MRSAQKPFCQEGTAVSTKNSLIGLAVARSKPPANKPVPNLRKNEHVPNLRPQFAQFAGLVAGAEGVPAFVLVDGQGHVKEVGEDLVAQ